MTLKKVVEDGIEYTVYTDIITGSSRYRYHGKLHRVNGPAIEYISGDKFWYKNGELHREDGPAVVYASGAELYCINGESLTEEEYKIEMRKIKLSIIS